MLCGVNPCAHRAYLVSIALGAAGIVLGVAGYYLEAQNLGRVTIVLGAVSIFVGLFVGQGVIPGSYYEAVNGIKETIQDPFSAA